MIRRALAAAAVTVLALAVPAAPASAHSSSYCGHGQVGVFNTETYRGGHWSGGLHRHVIEHRTLFDFRHVHYTIRYCHR